jgi:hypothetical protein
VSYANNGHHHQAPPPLEHNHPSQQQRDPQQQQQQQLSHDQQSQQQQQQQQASYMNNGHHCDSHKQQENSNTSNLSTFSLLGDDQLQNYSFFVPQCQNRQSSGVPPLSEHNMNVAGGNESLGSATAMDDDKQQDSCVVSILLGLGQQG